MPLIRIDLQDGKGPRFPQEVADAVHQGLVEGLDIEPSDRFQIVTEHPGNELHADAAYGGVERSEVIFVQVITGGAYDADRKTAAFEAIGRRLEAIGVRPEDVFIVMTKNELSDWYAGRTAEAG